MKFLPRLLFRPTFLTGLSRHSAAHCPRTIDHLSGGEPVGNLRDSDPCLLALLCTRHKDDETVDLCDAVSTPAYLRDGDVVLLADFDWLWPKGPESAGTSVEVASSETRLFSHPSGSSDPLIGRSPQLLIKDMAGVLFYYLLMGAVLELSDNLFFGLKTSINSNNVRAP